MKNILALALLFTIKAHAQKDKTFTNTQGLKIINSNTKNILSVAMPGYEDFYIIANNKIYAKEELTKKVIPIDDINNANAIRWTVLKNADGSVNICNKMDQSKKLIEFSDWSTILAQGTSIRNTGSAGTTLGTASRTKAFFLDTSNSTTTRNLVNRWFLRNISGDKHWLIYPNRMDSFQIRILQKSSVPTNVINWNFEDMLGWETAGDIGSNAFIGQPSTINYIPFYSSPVIPAMPLGGDYWKDLENKFFSTFTRTIGKYINSSRPGSDPWNIPNEAKTGTLTSKPFLLNSERINYRIAGTQDDNSINVAIFQKIATNEPGAISYSDGYYKLISTSVATGHNNDITRQIAVPLSELKYSVCRIRIMDNSTTGHILVSGINFEDRPTITTESIPANPVLPSAQKPIWGAIDTHTHPMAFMGMGGKLMYGKLDGNPAQELGNCNAIHGGFGIDNVNGNYFRAEVVNLLDEHNEINQVRYKLEDIKVPHNDHQHEGFPNFVHWPSQKSMIHQQMWYEWLRRARDGGLKSIVALTINSESLGRALGGDGPYDDATTSDREVDSLIAFVHRHNDFLDTVTSSARMRQVVNEGKMAIIIGMEIDNIGNFYQNISVTTNQIRDEITRIKNKGVRYIFPIHVTNNKFGGAAVYKDFFNFGNKYSSGQPTTGLDANLYPPKLPGSLFKVESALDRQITFRLGDGAMGKYVPLAVKFRPLLEVIEAGGFPLLPPPLLEPSLAIKKVVDPVIGTLRASQQYQMAKKIFLDGDPEMSDYANIKFSETDKGGHRNVLGLTDEGKFAVAEMMRQGLIIDMDHASEKSVNDMIDIALRNDYPVNAGHNSLRGHGSDEKTRTRAQLDAIKRLGGMMGIGWEEQTPEVFNSIFNQHLTLMGNRNTTFGSDINGYAATPLKPTSASNFINYTNNSAPDFLQKYEMPGSPRIWDYNNEGMAHIGLVPDFFQAIKKAGATPTQLNALFLSAEYFVQMWEKCERRAPLVER